MTQSFETGNKAGQSKISTQPKTKKVPTIEKQFVSEELQQLHTGDSKVLDNTENAVQTPVPNETIELEIVVRTF